MIKVAPICLPIKQISLSYTSLVAWEEPPTRDSGPLWDAFERAYANYVEGFFTHVPTHLKAKNEEARSKDFGEDLELKDQPEYLSGGEMMDYQKEGMK
jgi:chromodomain-helicase-DNA-binding protein 4